MYAIIVMRLIFQRGNFLDHEKNCRKKIVQCPSGDNECPWEGLRDEQDIRLEKCLFQQMRPIINLLLTQLNLSLNKQNELQEKLEDQSNQIKFFLAFINQGNTMNKECLKSSSRCQYPKRSKNKRTTILHCTLCQKTIRRRDDDMYHYMLVH